jgi:hypothetical protein
MTLVVFGMLFVLVVVGMDASGKRCRRSNSQKG